MTIVEGPPGAGRSRLVREAARALQLARAAAREPVPTYLRVERAPAEPPRGDAIVHLDASETSLAAARAYVDAARLDLRAVAVVIEAAPGALDRAEGAAAADVARVEIGPLDEHALVALLASASGIARPPAALVAAAREASGGLAGRLCRLIAGGLGGGVDPFRPEAMRELGATPGEHGALPEPARRLAEVCASAGGELDLAIAAPAAGLDEQGSAAAVVALLASGAASAPHGGRVLLRKDVASAIRAALPARRRAELARALEGAALEPAARAFLRASTGDAPAAIAALLEALEARRRAGDPESAIALARALSGELGDAATEPVRVALADALRARARYDEADAALEGCAGAPARALGAEVARLRGDRDRARREAEAARAARPSDAAGAQAFAAATALLARLALDAGDEASARSLAEGVRVERGAGEAAQARALEVLVLCALARGELDGAAALERDLVELARASGDAALDARAASLGASVALARGEPHRALERYARAVERADRAGELHAAASFLVNLGLARLDVGEAGPAIAALREGARRLARLGREQDLARAMYNLANACALVGDDDSRADRGRARAASGDRGAATASRTRTRCWWRRPWTRAGVSRSARRPRSIARSRSRAKLRPACARR